MLSLVPLKQADAKDFVREHHRHHKPPAGSVINVGVRDREGELRGVAMAGRPIARNLDDGLTLEVTRCCTDGATNACSMLYGAVRRAAKALGYKRLLTYTLESEPGTSLRAAGWVAEAKTDGGVWSRPSRRRADDHPTEPKIRWSALLHPIPAPENGDE